MKQQGTPGGQDTPRPRDDPPPTLRTAQRLLARGDLTPPQLLERYLARVPDADAAGAFVLVDPDGARAQAARLDPTPRGPLHGIPIAVKDLVDVAGWPTRAGRRDGPVAAEDAPVVAALRRAGAVVVGKTRTDELGLGTFTPGTHHPREPGRSVGGSSGGSAVAVALGAVPLALATDTAGSARIPAAACGVAGLCRAPGAWPPQGVVGLSPRFDRLGILTADAADLVTAWRALGGSDAAETGASGGPDRVLVLDPEALGRVDDAAAAATAATAAHLAGAVDRAPEEITAPAPREFGPDRAVVITGDAARTHPVRAAESALVRDQLLAGARHDPDAVAAAWARLDRRGAALRDRLGAGVLVLPTLPAAPPRVDDLGTLEAQYRSLGRLTRLCAPVNSSGLVAASLPVATDGDGRPVGVQLVAGTEAVLLASVGLLAAV